MAKKDIPETDKTFAVTQVNKVKRVPSRGSYDKDAVYAILDSALICNVAYVIDDQPYSTPTNFWREGNHIYWHGSSASRMIRAVKDIPVCITVSHVDSLVMARSGFHHSVNYRAVMAFGKAYKIEDDELKLKLMDSFIDRIYPGRSKIIRQPWPQEFKATTMMGMEIDTASAKVRDTHVLDEDIDYENVSAWSALYPITQILGAPSECPRTKPSETMPPEMAIFKEGARLDDVMLQAYRQTFLEK